MRNILQGKAVANRMGELHLISFTNGIAILKFVPQNLAKSSFVAFFSSKDWGNRFFAHFEEVVPVNRIKPSSATQLL